MSSARFPTLPRSDFYEVEADGIRVEVLHTGVADFVHLRRSKESMPLVVHVRRKDRTPLTKAVLRPAARRIPINLVFGVAEFQLASSGGYTLETEVGKPLYLFFKSNETSLVHGEDAGVVLIGPGEVVTSAELNLDGIHTLCVQEGAVLKGPLHLKGREGFRLCGHGIIEGDPSARRQPLLIFESCRNLVVEGVTLIRPPAWMLVPANCDGVVVRDVSMIGEVMCSDGIDVLGSSRVLVEGCFLHNNDDCVAIKAFHLGARNVEGVSIDARRSVLDVAVRRCVFANWNGGNAMEIGHELAVDSVRGVVFSDIDVLHVHDKGAVFAIHCYDRAHVSDVVFEKIRIEHCYDKLIDFRVSRSRYSSDEARGRISDVQLRDIDWTTTPYNAGYTVSMVGGAGPGNVVERVSLQRFRIDGREISSLEELEIHTRHCVDLSLAP